MNLRLRRIDRDFRGIEIRLRDQALGRQFFRARVLLLRVGERNLASIEVRLRFHEVGSCLLDLRVEQRRIELCDDLTLLDDRIEIGAEP